MYIYLYIIFQEIYIKLGKLKLEQNRRNLYQTQVDTKREAASGNKTAAKKCKGSISKCLQTKNLHSHF